MQSPCAAVGDLHRSTSPPREDVRASATWRAAFQDIACRCEAAQRAVARTEAAVRDDLVPRLERLHQLSDECEAALADMAGGVRLTVSLSDCGATCERATDITGTREADALSGLQLSRQRRPISSLARAAPHSGTLPQRGGAASPSPPAAEDGVAQLEAELAALIQHVERRQRAAVRQTQQHAMQVQRLQCGIDAVERHTAELQRLLRALRLERHELCELLQQPAEAVQPKRRWRSDEESSSTAAAAPPSPPLSSPSPRRVDGTADSLEISVQALELLLEQERAVRDAQVQSILHSFARLEAVQVARVQGPHQRPPRSSTLTCASGQTRADVSRGGGGGGDGTSTRGGGELHRRRAVSSAGAAALRDRLCRFFSVYDPRMIDAAEEVVRRFCGPPEELFAVLELRYDAYGYFSFH
ncbi:hypothetical protein NESM_000200400 [Novymonas esmeraldas]|uniref:Uncharacterized protein n=1 Tax=Novymonas esmeraldas TaxID=1808958 RepID=A0AAW0F6Q1_9TRYP